MKDFILIQQICSTYDIPESFIEGLYDYDLIEIVEGSVSPNQIETIERLIRLHYDLDINMEGLQAITGLLNRIEELQAKINTLENRLAFFQQYNLLDEE